MSTLPNKQNQQLGMPGYRGTYLPLPPLPTYPFPPSMGQPQLPAQQGQVPVAAQPAPQRTWKDKLGDPRLAALLSAIGANMSQPRAVGQTGWGQVGSSLSAGYNTLAAMRALQDQRDRQYWQDQMAVRKDVREETESAAKVAATGADTAYKQKVTGQLEEELRLKKAAETSLANLRAAQASGIEADIVRAKADAAEKVRQYNASLAQRQLEHKNTVSLENKKLGISSKNAEANLTEARARANALLQDAAKTKYELSIAKESADPKSKTAMETRLRGIPAQITEINKVLELMNPGPEKMQLETMRDSLTMDYNSLRQKLGYTQEAPAGAGGATGTRRKYNPATGKIE